MLAKQSSEPGTEALLCCARLVEPGAAPQLGAENRVAECRGRDQMDLRFGVGALDRRTGRRVRRWRRIDPRLAVLTLLSVAASFGIANPRLEGPHGTANHRHPPPSDRRLPCDARLIARPRGYATGVSADRCAARQDHAAPAGA